MKLFHRIIENEGGPSDPNDFLEEIRDATDKEIDELMLANLRIQLDDIFEAMKLKGFTDPATVELVQNLYIKSLIGLIGTRKKMDAEDCIRFCGELVKQAVLEGLRRFKLVSREARKRRTMM